MSVEHATGKSSSRATLDVEGKWMRTSTCVAVGSSLLLGAQGDFTGGSRKVGPRWWCWWCWLLFFSPLRRVVKCGQGRSIIDWKGLFSSVPLGCIDL